MIMVGYFGIICISSRRPILIRINRIQLVYYTTILSIDKETPMSKKKFTLISSLVGILFLSKLVYGRIIKHTSGPMNA
jgi:hypothetical protein